MWMDKVLRSNCWKPVDATKFILGINILTNTNLHGRTKEESHLPQKTGVCTAVYEKKELHVIRTLKADFERRIQAIRKERDWHEAEAKQWREAAQEAAYEIVGLEDHCHLLQKVNHCPKYKRRALKQDSGYFKKVLTRYGVEVGPTDPHSNYEACLTKKEVMPIKEQILGDSSDSKSYDTSENSTRCSPASSRETLTLEFEVQANNFRNEFHAYKMDQVSLVNLTNIQPQQSKESWPRMQPVHTELQGMDEDVVSLERWIAIRTKLTQTGSCNVAKDSSPSSLMVNTKQFRISTASKTLCSQCITIVQVGKPSCASQSLWPLLSIEMKSWRKQSRVLYCN
ncbi:hypothetical protein LOZ66_000538 [Ophidiomyces ophidiicola]|nr:hypothetical protein LOZ66_000538 [Ophidiomyces ophidiicola]